MMMENKLNIENVGKLVVEYVRVLDVKNLVNFFPYISDAQ